MSPVARPIPLRGADADEFENAIADQFAAGKRAIILNHHGLYAVGEDARDAWFVTFHLKQAPSSLSRRPAPFACRNASPRPTRPHPFPLGPPLFPLVPPPWASNPTPEVSRAAQLLATATVAVAPEPGGL